MIPENYTDHEIHARMGGAIQAYSRVEQEQARVIAAILKIGQASAKTIIFSVQNVRARNEMIQTLLSLNCKDKHKKYWASCAAYLLQLSLFRNAIVHWLPVTIYTIPDGAIAQGLRNGTPLKSTKTLEVADFSPFIDDCTYINLELEQFAWYLEGHPNEQAWHEKFSRPLARRNRAVLLQPPTPTEPKPRPESARGLRKRRARQRRGLAPA